VFTFTFNVVYVRYVLNFTFNVVHAKLCVDLHILSVVWCVMLWPLHYCVVCYFMLWSLHLMWCILRNALAYTFNVVYITILDGFYFNVSYDLLRFGL